MTGFIIHYNTIIIGNVIRHQKCEKYCNLHKEFKNKLKNYKKLK